MSTMQWSGVAVFVTCVAACANGVALSATLMVPGQFPTIQAAIDASANGDVINVAPGTYVEHIRFKGKAITVRGVAGAATTVLDGAGVGPVVRFTELEGPGSRLEGVRVTNGASFIGGGILAISSSPTISECIVDACSAVERGGGLAILAGDPEVSQCTFTNNTARVRGGAVYVASGASPVFEGCTFESNSVLPLYSTDPCGGGAIAVLSASADVSGCDFVDNLVSDDDSTGGSSASGGGMFLESSSMSLLDSTFYSNAATASSANRLARGGAIRAMQSSLTLTACAFQGNTASNSTSSWASGGAVDADSLTVDGCMFEENLVQGGQSYGGISSSGAAIQATNATVLDCTFALNKVTGGGATGGAVSMNTGTIDSCQFALNASQGGGGGLAATAITITSSSFVGNVAASGGAIYAPGGTSGSQLIMHACDLSLNAAGGSGGAVSGGNYGNFVLRVTASSFDGNSATSGGAIYLYPLQAAPDPLFEDCLFTGNTGTQGGGLMLSAWSWSNTVPALRRVHFVGNACTQDGGALYFNGVGRVIEDSQFFGNVADRGGAVFSVNFQSIGSLYSSLFAQNTSTTGSACFAQGNPLTITSCQFCDNAPPQLVNWSDGGGNVFGGGDCNGNGTCDLVDIATGEALDCNLNAIPDECDIASGASHDLNLNGIPDECEQDCNANGIPDDYEIASGLVADCDDNGSPDGCDIAGGASDIDGNGVLDTCQADCNGNGVPDTYELFTGVGVDCDQNGVLDECDVANGAVDINHDGVPDVCQCLGDLTGDGAVLANDLAVLLGFWGPVGPYPPADLNGDGAVDAMDLAILLGNWGPC
ncbi:MAG: hypothetical protein U0572_09675 [Phycisphaerales bacterium]